MTSPRFIVHFLAVLTIGGDAWAGPPPSPLLPPPVRINEVVSENTGGLKDEDGSFEDWIELFNATDAPVDLTGWHLTDDRSLPKKWKFPATMLAPGGYRIVFASGKDRAVAGAPLHTNFRLAREGEFLALNGLDGAVVDRIAPIPGLARDRSFGHGLGNSRSLIGVPGLGVAVRWHVPTAEVDAAWRGGTAFDDNQWTTGSWSLGYGQNATTAYAIETGAVGNQSYPGPLGMDFNVLRPVQVTELACFDSGSNGLSRTITVVLWSRNANGTPASTADDTAGTVRASLTFTGAAPGTLVGGQRFKPLATPITLQPGSYTIVAYNYGASEQNGNTSAFPGTTHTGDGALEFVGTARYGGGSAPSSPAASWPATPDGGPATRYAAGSFIFREAAGVTTSTESAMRGVNATVLTRTTFALTGGPPACPVLDITFDDGFVAWLNGVEIARRHAPADLGFAAAATAPETATLSVPLSGLEAVWRPVNVLAIQGLNRSADDTDFFLQAFISGEASGPVLGFLSSPTPGAPNRSATLAAAPVISEIHSDPPASKSVFTEFIEIYNPLPAPVDLGGWSLTGGVTLAIPPGTIIPPCGYLVLAENPDALATHLKFPGALGPWSGRLRNEGEEIVLRDATSAVVDRVDYGLGFPWPTVGDEAGHSLQRIHEGLDGDLGGSWRSGPPTPGARNALTSGAAPPAIRQVTHTPVAPRSAQPVTVTAKITDPDRLAGAVLEYQTVDPGAYIRLSDALWKTKWESLDMNDRGTDGDSAADDDIFTAVIPATVQIHRRLVRYRLRAWDGALDEIQVPYADDDCPNFAYFCYDGVPAWTGAVRPGVTPADTFSAATMAKVRAWHLLANATDVQNCQYNNGFNDGTYRFQGAMVVGDRVYDHVRFRVKGQNSTYNTGKNKWKFRFNRGRLLEMPDDYGLTTTPVRTLNISSVPAPWAPWNRGMHGLDEAMAFRLSDLAGVPSPRTSYLQFRVIDGASEQNPSNQFDGDLWGLYLAFENTDNFFKEAHGLPDGNIFRLQATGAGNSVLGQGEGQPTNLSDLNAFTSPSTGYRRGGGSTTTAPALANIQPESWFRTHVDLPEYFSWRAVTEAINQTDRREQENVVYFRRPPPPTGDGRWLILPWDCDLLYENFDRWGPQSVQTAHDLQQYEQISRALLHPAILTEFQNRARELQDLLLNSDQAWKVVDEFISLITDESPRVIPLGGPIDDGFVEVERRRWDYNPSNPTPPRGAGPRGNYYKSPYPIGNMNNGPTPQPYRRVLASADFEGMVTWIKEFIAAGPNGGARLAKIARGEVAPYTLKPAPTITIPDTPTINYSGPPGFPLNQLQFTSSGFNSPNGQTFAALQWRLGEVYDPSVTGFRPGDPWRYEITGVWTPEETTAFSPTVTVPASGLFAGRTYRARVRHKDSLGRWSHWSAPREFQAGAGVPGPLVSHLVISELMYHPPAPAGDDAAFIELLNIHPTSPLDLTGVQFTSGIAFSFAPGTQLAPGARLLIVSDAAVFAATYAGNHPIAGEYTGNLARGGERLTLSLGANTPLRDFAYDDALPWPTEADGRGASLVLLAPHTNPDHANPLSWRASATPNPNATDSLSYADWKNTHNQIDDAADTDCDGLNTVAEYTLGGHPAVPSTSLLPSLISQPNDPFILRFTRPLTHDESTWLLESATSLNEWHSIPPTVLDRRAADGFEIIDLALPSPTPTTPSHFWRLRFVLEPF
ncbi:MAG: lamin tail domain-containing protein [Verrucomicrobiales bacterium]